jgi:topoisomerase IA-like protein
MGYDFSNSTSEAFDCRYVECFHGETRVRQQIPSSLVLENLTVDAAAKLLCGPESLGTHPETNLPVLLKKGRYSAYFEHGALRCSAGRLAVTDPVTLEVAIKRLDVKASRLGAIKHSHS